MESRLLINLWSVTVIVVVLTAILVAPGETLVAAVVAIALNRVGGPRWRVNMGLMERITTREFATVLLLSVMLFFLTKLILQPLCDLITDHTRDLHSFDRIRGHPAAAVKLILVAIVLAGLCEEIIFRGTVLQRLRSILGPGRAAVIASVVLSAAIFAAFHWYQGPSGMLLTLVLGAIDGAIYVGFGSRLLVTVIVHAVYDTMALTAIATNYDLVLSRWGSAVL